MTHKRRTSIGNIDCIGNQCTKTFLIDPLFFKFVESKCDFTCPLCLSEISKPVYCVNCNQIFCQECINNWHDYSNTCPVCKRRWKKSHNDIIFEIITILNARKTKEHLCAFCFKPLSLTRIQEHISTCPLISNCPNCNIYVSNYELLDHEKKCPKSKVICSLCEKKVEKSAMEIHRKYCGKVLCKICNFWYAVEDFENHIHSKTCAICGERDHSYVECNGCGRVACSTCSSNCHECKKNFCLSCKFFCTGCYTNYCHRCEMYSPCDSCEVVHCSECTMNCEVCHKVACYRCKQECGCGKTLCGDCGCVECENQTENPWDGD